MSTASDWQHPIFGLEQREPMRARVLALVVVSAVVVGSVGVALSGPQIEDSTVSRPAPTPSPPPALPALVPLELPAPAQAPKKAAVERKARPAHDVLGERL